MKSEKAKELGGQNAFPFDNKNKFYYEMSLREYFAGLAMQGILYTGTCHLTNLPKLAETSTNCADALLEELAKEVEEEKK